MRIYPAIDLQNGNCVRLYQGAFDQATTYSNDPLAVAQEFLNQGAEFLHVVDLDGAKNAQATQTETILYIAKQTPLKLQVGGGIREKTQLEKLFAGGISKVVLGSIAIANPETVQSWLTEFGAEKIVLACDVKIQNDGTPHLASHGWQQDTQLSLWSFLASYQDFGLKHVLCTDIQRDGTLQGPNIQLYRECKMRFPTMHFQASGGIGNLLDLKALKEIPIDGAIIGKALYEKKFTLAEACKEVLYVS